MGDEKKFPNPSGWVGIGAKNIPAKSEHMRGTLTKFRNSKETFMTKLMTKPMTFEKLMTKFQNLMTEILS